MDQLLPPPQWIIESVKLFKNNQATEIMQNKSSILSHARWLLPIGLSQTFKDLFFVQLLQYRISEKNVTNFSAMIFK